MTSSGYLDEDDPGPPASLRGAWVTWLLATAALALYAFGAEVETRVESIVLPLTPGDSVEITVPRLFPNPLQLEIELPCPPAPPGRARLTPPAPQIEAGLLKLQAEPAVRLEVSSGGGDSGGDVKPVLFESLSTNGTCMGPLRRLTTNIAIAPGVYHWPPPPETPSFMLEPGFNQLRIKVVAADPPLAGRRTVLHAPGSIQLATSQPNVDWLWPALYLDLLFPVTQAIWLLVLIRRTLRPRRGSA